MNYILFNPLADNGAGEENAKTLLPELKKVFPNPETKSVLELENFYENLKEEDNVVLIGGDGTLNHFVNDIKGVCPKGNVYLRQAGTGNDFLNSLPADAVKDGLVLLNPYLKNLPTVTVKGKTYYFINGVGFGIDGECCRVADEQKAKGKKKISYPLISIKLLLFTFKRPDAVVKVDGKEYKFHKAGIASAMFGACYGGGMHIAPDQTRDNGVLTNVVFHKASRIKTLMVFVKTFKGEHVKYNKMVSILTGKKIEVTFTRPCALQIDGETIKDVTSYVAEIK
ncbi:MAG: diacylglycerol kinase family protein [Bacilli bacterium]|nr:diacylglycerol kinase family protein [Bacilli bacterium]